MAIARIDTFTDEEFILIVQNSHSVKEVAQKLGYVSYSGDLSKRIQDRINETHISTERFNKRTGLTKRSEENVFVQNSTACQKTLRFWYIKGCYTPYQCSICGQEPWWQNKELTLILDHKSGINNDNRLENLRWVCPNCNQQLDTTNGKNIVNLKQKQ